MKIPEYISKFASLLKKRGLQPDRVDSAVAAMGQAIPADSPALAKARVSAYKAIGLPTPELENGVSPARDALEISTDKEGWRNLLSNKTFLEKRNNLTYDTITLAPVRSEGKNHIYAAGDIEWSVAPDNKVSVRHYEDGKPVEIISGFDISETVARSYRRNLPIPIPIEYAAVDAYGVAPLFVGCKFNICGIDRLGVIADSGAHVPLNQVLSAFHQNDLLDVCGAHKLPDDLKEIPKEQLIRGSKYFAPMNPAELEFSNTGPEISSAMQVLHPEYAFAVDGDGKPWLFNKETRNGLPCKEIAAAWQQLQLQVEHGKLRIVPETTPEIAQNPEPSVSFER